MVLILIAVAHSLEILVEWKGHAKSTNKKGTLNVNVSQVVKLHQNFKAILFPLLN